MSLYDKATHPNDAVIAQWSWRYHYGIHVARIILCFAIFRPLASAGISSGTRPVSSGIARQGAEDATIHIRQPGHVVCHAVQTGLLTPAVGQFGQKIRVVVQAP